MKAMINYVNTVLKSNRISSLVEIIHVKRMCQIIEQNYNHVMDINRTQNEGKVIVEK